MPRETAGPWLERAAGDKSARLRLFCFPYAGGGSMVYRGWQASLPAGVELCPVQLPGRERRMREPCITDARELARAAAEALRPYLDVPFALFGHSMGALVSFELARSLRREGGPEPAHLFVSGHYAPQLTRRTSPTYDLPEREFIEELRRLNGTPREVIEHPELMQLMIPILRADFKLVQTYAYADEPPLGCPITAFGGECDPEVSRDSLAAWGEQTSGVFSLRMFPGDHFFLHTQSAPLLRAMAPRLEAAAGGTGAL